MTELISFRKLQFSFKASKPWYFGLGVIDRVQNGCTYSRWSTINTYHCTLGQAPNQTESIFISKNISNFHVMLVSDLVLGENLWILTKSISGKHPYTLALVCTVIQGRLGLLPKCFISSINATIILSTNPVFTINLWKVLLSFSHNETAPKN